MNDNPFALFLTWTTYGTWLPGDKRGHVSNSKQPDETYLHKENRPGVPYRQNEPATLTAAQRLQKYPTIRLTTEQANIVATALISAATSHDWRIIRAAIMANHVHVVVINCPPDGPEVRRVLKGQTQAALSAHSGIHKWWTTGGSDRYLNDEPSIEAAIRYVADQDWPLAEIIDMQIKKTEGLNPPAR